MPKLHTATALAANFHARFPQPGEVDIAAAAAPEVKFPRDAKSVDIQAAGVHSFTAPGKMLYVKATDHFLVLGETIQAGEYVELPEADAKYLVNTASRAEFATDEEVAAAQKQSRGGK